MYSPICIDRRSRRPRVGPSFSFQVWALFGQVFGPVNFEEGDGIMETIYLTCILHVSKTGNLEHANYSTGITSIFREMFSSLLLLVSCSGFAIDSKVCSVIMVSSKAADLTTGPLVAHRALGTAMMAAKYLTVESLEIAIREHIATTYAEGSLDDESLPSPLNYKELSFHGRDDLVEGCMAFGGYLQLSQALGLPVRIGVVRAESDVPLGRQGVVVEQGTKVFNLFNMFGRSG